MIPYPLTRALRLTRDDPKPLIAFVGAGGKTTAMFALAEELAAQGWRVVTTTTTRLFAAQREESPTWCAIDELDRLSEALDAHGHVLVSVPLEKEEVVPGLDPAQVVALHQREDVDAVLVEADGSRSRLFKAPAPHEPVIPEGTTYVVALVGAQIFGKRLDERFVHRPERVAEIGGVELGSIITPDLVTRVLASPEGGLYRVPEPARFLPLFTCPQTTADQIQVQQTAHHLLTHTRVTEVLCQRSNARTLERSNARTLQRSSRAAAVVLAAGEATRFGQAKQLLRWKGQPLVALAAQTALELCETVLVVVGHEAEAVAGAVEHLPVEVIFNPDYRSGQGSSVAAGASALLDAARPFIGETFFMVADQPLLTPALLRELRKIRGLHRIAVPRHRGRRGNPVLFDRALLPALTEMSGDVGGRALFEQYADEIAWLELEDGAVLTDVDTPAAWERLRRWEGA